MNIKEQIQQPEGRRLEFKAQLPTNAELAKSILAFAVNVFQVELADIGSELGLSWDQVGTKSGPSWNQVGTKSALSWASIDSLLNFCNNQQAIAAIMEQEGWKNRTKFRNGFIKPLLELELISMTIPDKPNSSKQKYYTTEKGKLVLKQLNTQTP